MSQRLSEPAPSETSAAPEAPFRAGEVTTIAGGHFVHDTYSAFVAPLLPLLQERLATGYALTGALAVFPQLPSLLNPLIGYLADKVSLRYFVILAPALTATLMSSMGLANDYLSLALLLLAAGVSVAAFHAPAPAMIGAIAGRRVGTGMSVFMAAGELGRTLGPVVAVAAVGWFGLEGIWRLAAIGWLVSGLLFWRLRRVDVRPATRERVLLPWARAQRLFPALGALMLTRVLMVAALTTYLPLFMRDAKGSDLWLAAASLAILEAAGVVGALLSGTLSDRLGRRRVLGFALGLAPPLLLAFLFAPPVLAVPLLLALGLTTLAPTPVFLALVQDQFPHHRALANGTFLAMNFLIRALGIWGVGLLADGLGLHSAFVWSASAAVLSLPVLLALPRG